MPMPESGPSRLCFRLSNMLAGSPLVPTFMPRMAAATESMVPSRPQKVPEQAEEDQQAGEVAGNLPAFIQPRLDTVEERTGRRGGEAELAAGLVAQHRRHRCEQARLGGARAMAAGAEILHPGDVGVEADHLPEQVQRADRQHAENEGVEERIVEEGEGDRIPEPARDEGPRRAGDDHPQQLASRSAHAIGSMSAVGMMLGRTPGQEAGTISTRSAGPPSALLPRRAHVDPGRRHACLDQVAADREAAGQRLAPRLALGVPRCRRHRDITWIRLSMIGQHVLGDGVEPGGWRSPERHRDSPV